MESRAAAGSCYHHTVSTPIWRETDTQQPLRLSVCVLAHWQDGGLPDREQEERERTQTTNSPDASLAVCLNGRRWCCCHHHRAPPDSRWTAAAAMRGGARPTFSRWLFVVFEHTRWLLTLRCAAGDGNHLVMAMRAVSPFQFSRPTST